MNWLVFFAFYCAGAAHGSHPNLRTTSAISLKLRPHCRFYKLPLLLTTTDYRLPQDGWIVVNYFMRMKFTANKVTITFFFFFFLFFSPPAWVEHLSINSLWTTSNQLNIAPAPLTPVSTPIIFDSFIPPRHPPLRQIPPKYLTCVIFQG